MGVLAARHAIVTYQLSLAPLTSLVAGRGVFGFLLARSRSRSRCSAARHSKQRAAFSPKQASGSFRRQPGHSLVVVMEFKSSAAKTLEIKHIKKEPTTSRQPAQVMDDERQNAQMEFVKDYLVAHRGCSWAVSPG